MKRIFTTAIATFCIFCLALVYSVWVQGSLKSNIVRMHIIANSNSVYDQWVKLRVRDEILAFAKENQVYDCSYSNVAEEYLKKINAPYGASAKIEISYVPRKSYKSVSLPQGYYNCIKVTLGKGAGENWWCIAYPPLCYTEGMFGDLSPKGKNELKKILSGEIMSVIENDGGINFRLKIVDEMQKLVELIKEKQHKSPIEQT